MRGLVYILTQNLLFLFLRLFVIRMFLLDMEQNKRPQVVEMCKTDRAGPC